MTFLIPAGLHELLPQCTNDWYSGQRYGRPETKLFSRENIFWVCQVAMHSSYQVLLWPCGIPGKTVCIH